MKTSFLGILTFFFISQAFAQGNDSPLAGQDSMVLENDRITEIIESEKPILGIPVRKVKEPNTSEIRYNPKTYYVESEIELPPVQPQAFQPNYAKADTGYRNLVKLSLGKYITPMIRVALVNPKGSALKYGLDFTHLSAHLDAIPLRNFRDDGLTFRLQKKLGDNDLSFKFSAFNTSYFNYGGNFRGQDTIYKDSLAKTSFSGVKDSLRNGFTQLDLGVNWKHEIPAKGKFGYGVGFKVWDIIKQKSLFRATKEGHSFNELNLALSPEFQYLIGKVYSLDWKNDIIYGNLLGNLITAQHRILARSQPQFVVENGAWKVRVGANVAYYHNAADTVSKKFGVAPAVQAEYELIPMKMYLQAGVVGGMKYNDLFHAFGENRFLSSAAEIRPSFEPYHAYLGTTSSALQKLNYSAKVYFRQVNNQMMYVTPVDGRYFDIEYVKLYNAGVKLEGVYEVNRSLQAGARFNYNFYRTDNSKYQNKFLQQPAVTAQIFAHYVWNNKLNVQPTLYIYGATPMAVSEVAIGGQTLQKRPFFADLSFNADYRISKRWSAFVGANNLLALKYQRWWNYIDRRFDFRIGTTFAF
ncbi:MAG: hypothetical protein ACKVTZ_15400 [Bacteroidia bacterium]